MLDVISLSLMMAVFSFGHSEELQSDQSSKTWGLTLSSEP